MAENNEEQRHQQRANENDPRNEKGSQSTDKSNDNGDANVADQASQNDYATIDTSKVPNEDEELSNNDDPDEDRDRWTPENGAEFSDEDAKYTTLDPHYNEEEQELDALFNPTDDKLRALKALLQKNKEKLEGIDTDDPHALSQMRDLMVENNDIESRIYEIMHLLETHSTDYQKIKDRLLPENSKAMFQRLKPLFDISKKEQMDTFVSAFYNINRIEKEGYLSNLVDLATFFKEHKREILGDDDESGGQDGTPGK